MVRNHFLIHGSNNWSGQMKLPLSYTVNLFIFTFCQGQAVLCQQMSHDITKPTKWVCAQRRLRSAWASSPTDLSSLCTQWVAKYPRFLHAISKDFDQTGRMPRLIWVFAGRTIILLVLSCHGSKYYGKHLSEYLSIEFYRQFILLFFFYMGVLKTNHTYETNK